MNIPSILLHNSFTANSIESLSETANFKITNSVKDILLNSFPVSPYWIFPLGLRNFLNHLVINNPYIDTFQMIEILDEQSVLRNIQNMLGKNYKNKLNYIVQDYLDKLNLLPTPDMLINSLCNK